MVLYHLLYDMNIINKKFTLTENDLFNFYLTHVYKRKFLHIGLTILFLVFLINAILRKDNISIAITSIGILIEVFIPILMKRRSKKEYASNSFFKKEHTYTVTSEEITSAIEDSYNKITWDDVFSLYETNNYLLIYLSENKTLMLPKRVLNEEEIKTIIGWAKEHLDAKKIKVKS